MKKLKFEGGFNGFWIFEKRVKNERIVNEFDLSFLCEFRPLSPHLRVLFIVRN
jgi:hypothetical protein